VAQLALAGLAPLGLLAHLLLAASTPVVLLDHLLVLAGLLAHLLLALLVVLVFDFDRPLKNITSSTLNFLYDYHNQKCSWKARGLFGPVRLKTLREP